MNYYDDIRLNVYEAYDNGEISYDEKEYLLEEADKKKITKADAEDFFNALKDNFPDDADDIDDLFEDLYGKDKKDSDDDDSDDDDNDDSGDDEDAKETKEFVDDYYYNYY